MTPGLAFGFSALSLFKRDALCFFCFFGLIFEKIGQNGRPGRQEAPRRISFDETSRMVSVWGRTRKNIFTDFCDLQKSRVNCKKVASRSVTHGAAQSGQFLGVFARWPLVLSDDNHKTMHVQIDAF